MPLTVGVISVSKGAGLFWASSTAGKGCSGGVKSKAG